MGGHVRPPPWSTLDMSNADFDTRHTSPRPAPPAAKPRQTGENTGQSTPKRLNPGQSLTSRAQRPPPRGQATPPKPRIYGEFTVSSARPPGPSRRAAPLMESSASRNADSCKRRTAPQEGPTERERRPLEAVTIPTSPAPGPATPIGHDRSRWAGRRPGAGAGIDRADHGPLPIDAYTSHANAAAPSAQTRQRRCGRESPASPESGGEP
jgi:hypothetical protein